MKLIFSEKILWVIQRLSAITNLLLLLWFVLSLNNFDILNYYETLMWIKVETNMLLILFVFISILLHASMGVSVIIDDYIHSNLKSRLLVLKNFLAFLFIFILGFCLYLILN